MKEMAYLELDMSKAFVRSPECNGCIERFNRTIKKEVFNIQRIYSLEQASASLKSSLETIIENG